MSWNYSIIVFKKSTAESYEKDAATLRQYLLEEKIIVELSDGETGETILKPGPASCDILMSFPPVLEGLAVHSHFDISENQVEILSGRQIFHESEGAQFTLTCKKCKSEFDGFKKPISDLLNQYYKGTKEDFICPSCAHVENLRLCDTSGFAAGFLGLRIWNWDPLKPEFIKMLGDQMRSEVCYIEGHL